MSRWTRSCGTRAAPVPRAVLVVLMALALLLTAVHAKPCYWLFEATEGVKSVFDLTPQWGVADCPSQRFSFTVSNANGNTAQFTSIRYPILEITPATTHIASGAVRYDHVDLSITCDAFTPVCDTATVYFVVHPAPAPAPAVVCRTPSPLSVEFGQRGTTPLLTLIEHCAAPQLRLAATRDPTGAAADALFAIETHDGQPSLVFDPAGVNARAGRFSATIDVGCGATSCTLEQVVTAKARPVEPTPRCERDYGFRVSRGSLAQERIVVHDEDAARCPVAAEQTRRFTFAPLTPPRYHPDEFVLYGDNGSFVYHAPDGAGVMQDEFTFTLRCGGVGSAAHDLCVGRAALLITAPPPPPVLSRCPGDFQFVYALTEDGAAVETQSFRLVDRARAAGDDAVTGATRFCPDGTYARATLTRSPANGTLTGWTATTGQFEYHPTHPAVGDRVDDFDFTLDCQDTAQTRCAATASVSIVPAPTTRPVYHAWNGAVVCRGTCDAAAWRYAPGLAGKDTFDTSPDAGPGVTPRRDGRATDELTFEFTPAGELLIRGYTTIGSMAARFVTFTPLFANATTPGLTSASVPAGADVSFDARCLDRQGAQGNASSVWTWTDPAELIGHVNLLTASYRSGNDYYQKFGGKHRSCDVFRDDPCRYAPMLTPAADAGVRWSLYVNDCDATWVGRATVETLRAMRQPDGRPTFTLLNGTHLRGTIYSQVVKPASWDEPDAGVLTRTRAYDVLLAIRSRIDVDAVAAADTRGGDVALGSDVIVHWGRVTETNERLFVYTLLLYPYHNRDGAIVNVNTSAVTLESIRLVNASWASPNAVECPQCTGTRSVCVGTGNDLYDTDCGADAVMTFTPLRELRYELDRPPTQNAWSGLAPSTSLAGSNVYNVTFGVRANGRDSATSADAAPVGLFYLHLTLSTGDAFLVAVNQMDYVSEIDASLRSTRMCRASAYWPVPDPLQDSLPVRPYRGDDVNDDATVTNATTFAAPAPLTPPATCRAPITARENDADNTIALDSLSSTLTLGNRTLFASMCAMDDVYTFGVTDWVTLSLPFVDPGVADAAPYTTAELQYLVLSVDADQTVLLDELRAPDDARVHVLLDGTAPLEAATTDEEGRWMGDGHGTQSPTVYYPWKTHVSSLNYRRIVLVHNETSAREPLHFAFIPGSLLHRDSDVQVHMVLKASVRFTLHEAGGATRVRDEKFMYIFTVSRSTSSDIRFDADAYTPRLVTINTPGLARSSATALLIVLIIGVVLVLAGSIYVEVTYKRIIHNAKYHPKRQDSAVGVRYGRDGRPKSAAITPRADLGGDRALPTTPPAALKTAFGLVQSEQRRVPHDDVSPPREEDEMTTPLAGGVAPRYVREPVKLTVSEEQARVADDDDEVAEF